MKPTRPRMGSCCGNEEKDTAPRHHPHNAGRRRSRDDGDAPSHYPSGAGGGGAGARAAQGYDPHFVCTPDLAPRQDKPPYNNNYSLSRVGKLDGKHAFHLKRPFANAQQKAMYSMSLLEWRAVKDRAAEVPGWKCSVAKPIDINTLKPIPVNLQELGCDSAAAPLLAEVLTNAFKGHFTIANGGVTDVLADAVVNAANEGCLGGGGVDGAMHRTAGPLLVRECATFNGCRTGHTRITKGYALPAKFVLHTVGPRGESREALTSAYSTCMKLARRFDLKSVCFCAISTGIFGYPLEKATPVCFSTIFPELCYTYLLAKAKQKKDQKDSASAKADDTEEDGKNAAAPVQVPKICFACYRSDELAYYQKTFTPNLKAWVGRMSTKEGRESLEAMWKAAMEEAEKASSTEVPEAEEQQPEKEEKVAPDAARAEGKEEPSGTSADTPSTSKEESAEAKEAAKHEDGDEHQPPPEKPEEPTDPVDPKTDPLLEKAKPAEDGEQEAETKKSPPSPDEDELL